MDDGGTPATLASAIPATSLWSQWDDAVRSLVLDTFEAIGWKEIRSPSVLTKDLPFVQTPTTVVTAVLGYLAVVVATMAWRSFSVDRTKPNGGKKADPPWLRLFVLMHNLFLVGLSTYMFLGTVYQARKYGYVVWGNMYSPEQWGMARMLYIFYLSKIYEFNDTFIMLMKGNIHQVSFLHVYHHVSISLVWWFLTYSCPGGDAYFTCALNSFVHILMYTYYLLAQLLGKDPWKREKYLWWGKYMTLFQMGQFITMMAQAVYCYLYTQFPKFLSMFLFVYMQTLLVLFGNFFVRKHILKVRPKGD